MSDSNIDVEEVDYVEPCCVCGKTSDGLYFTESGTGHVYCEQCLKEWQPDLERVGARQ